VQKVQETFPPALPPEESGVVTSQERANEVAEEGGDPACWLNRVCPACGRLADDDPPTRCPDCGEELRAD